MTFSAEYGYYPSMATRSAHVGETRPVENVDAEIGLRVHTLMWERRMTQGTLGDAVGLDQTGLGRRLRGERKWTPAELRAVSVELGVTVGYLFGEGGMTPPARPNGPLSDYSADGLAPIVSLFTRQLMSVGA